MTQEDSWMRHFNEIMQHIQRNKRRPSKHRPEERKMHNWIKYNKKLLAKGLLSHAREWRFRRLLGKAEDFRRLNQYAYRPKAVEQELDFQDD